MACAYHTVASHPDRRCPNCRYWFERCCHALALLEPPGQQSNCLHFVTERRIPSPLLEGTP